ncbi:MAG: extracellular solute-binding protein [Chloroflexi bacterium]|nr:extracellular solute-binding protein [Chloroflexota bacterium]
MKNTLYRLLSALMAMSLLLAACAQAPQEAAKEEEVKLTFWFWGEPDAPGANDWITNAAAEYKKVKPNVTVEVIPQGTDALISGFQTAVTAGSGGPDIASQWATGQVMGFVWQDALVAIDDYVAQDELANWLNLDENKYNGKIWGAPMYLLTIVVLYNQDLFAQAGVTPPAAGERWSWQQFQDACAKLKAAGITPFGIGDLGGYGGAWMWANFGNQNLDSVEDLRKAVIGEASFLDEKYTGFYKDLDAMVKNGYFNPDIMSRDLSYGNDLFSQGQVAMAFGTDGFLSQAIKDLGAAKVGLMPIPKYGTGKLAEYGNSTQSISFLITKQSKHPQEAADFLAFLHSPEMLKSWYQATGIVPADKRFDASLITDALIKLMYQIKTTGPQIWAENFIPGQLDAEGDLAAGELIFSQSGTPEEAAQIWENAAQTWRTQHPDELEKWKNWK